MRTLNEEQKNLAIQQLKPYGWTLGENNRFQTPSGKLLSVGVLWIRGKFHVVSGMTRLGRVSDVGEFVKKFYLAEKVS